MLRRANNIGRYLRIRVHLRRVERAQTEPNSQHPRQRAIHVRCLQKTSLYRQWNVRFVLGIVRVASGLDSRCCCFDRILEIVMARNQQIHSTQIVGHKAVEPPLSAQNVCEQLFVDRIWRTVDRVVRGHHRLCVAFHDGGLPMREPIFHQVALVHVG